MVLAEKPTISAASDALDPSLLRELLGELGSLASVYHKPAASFVSKLRLAVQRAEDLAAAAARGSVSGDSGGWDRGGPGACLQAVEGRRAGRQRGSRPCGLSLTPTLVCVPAPVPQKL